MAGGFRFEVLRAEHDRTAFSSGVEPLDRYFREQATQDIRRRVSACYVAIKVATSTIAGYYTLAAGGVPLVRCPRHSLRDFPRYESVPVVRLGRLAVDRRYPSGHLATRGGGWYVTKSQLPLQSVQYIYYFRHRPFGLLRKVCFRRRVT